MFLLLIAFGVAAKLGAIYFGSLALVLGALVYEHRSAARLDLGAIDLLDLKASDGAILFFRLMPSPAHFDLNFLNRTAR
jgi:hypothetical protein